MRALVLQGHVVCFKGVVLVYEMGPSQIGQGRLSLPRLRLATVFVDMAIFFRVDRCVFVAGESARCMLERSSMAGKEGCCC